MRNSEEFPFTVEGITYERFDGLAGTHCLVDDEFEVKTQSEQQAAIFRHDHFSARELCSGEDDKFKVNANMCASEGIIGPISDLIHIDYIEEGEEFD